MLSDYFRAVELTVVEVEETPVAFSGLAGNSLEMLFVDSTYRGHGVGSALLLRAIEYHPDLRLEVNTRSRSSADAPVLLWCNMFWTPLPQKNGAATRTTASATAA